MVEFVEAFRFYATNGTLGVYCSFLADALEYWRASCWREIAQIAVRIPVIHAMLAGDDRL
jgi:hypothetical protein